MKKQLMTTTALVTAGVLTASSAALAQGASKPKLALGGWFEGIVGIADNDDTIQPRRVGVDVMIDSEIHFKGSVTLDNGIRIRTRTELEGQSSNSGDQIDEAYIDVAGKFGNIRIGSEDNAPHLMVTPYMGTWGTQVGQNISFDTADWVERPGGLSSSNVNRLDLNDGDSEKISYFTPRIAGFQLGVTYMPSINEGGDGSPEPRNVDKEGFAVGATYSRKFGNVGIGGGLGYATMKPGPTDQSDPKGWVIGGRVDVGGFRFSAGWHSEKNLQPENTGADGSTDAFDIGARFKQGKNNFSVGYNHAEAPGSRTIVGDDEQDRILISYRRDLGPGVQYRLNFFWADWQGEAVGSADDNEGYAITTSVRIAF